MSLVREHRGGNEAMNVEILLKAIGQGGTCQSCSAPIYWLAKHPAKGHGFHPANPDGTSHFSSCPNAKDHRAQKAAADSGEAPLLQRGQKPCKTCGRSLWWREPAPGAKWVPREQDGSPHRCEDTRAALERQTMDKQGRTEAYRAAMEKDELPF
jgi:hypothetical protein